jgi:tetratricopeptide (TPR) repeat protein
VEWARAFFSGDPKHLSTAEMYANRALQLNPSASEAHKAASVVFFQQGHFLQSLEEAFTSLELADETDDYRLINRIPGNFRMLGRPDKAVPWYLLALKKTARPYDAYSLADCYVELGDDDRAAAGYKRAASLFPELPEGWMGLCRLSLLRQDFASATKIALENATNYRDFVSSQQMVAQVAFFSRNFTEAERLYRDLAVKDPNGGGSFFGALSYQSAVGRLRLAAQDQETGTQILNDALAKELESLRLAPNHPEILYRVAAIEASLGKTESALQHLTAATDAGWIDYRSTELDPRFDFVRDIQDFKNILAHQKGKVDEMRRQ